MQNKNLSIHPKRTHTCGELTEVNVNNSVTLKGWVKSRRDHGGLIFIDLRDRYGVTQVVFNPQKNKELHRLAEQLKPEYVIAIKGIAKHRPEGSVNPKLPTGQIEIEATELQILSKCDTPPFEIDTGDLPALEIRLKYRYLDLRRRRMQENLIKRHKITRAIRDYFDQQGFIEIETPFLTKSTPEGARDYLVPSRISPGQFYALPQSPQLFKQLLMAAGFDKYFQIVRCFRDEDLRADRQPEFTQIDVEMSFVDENDIIQTIEGMCVEAFRSARPDEPARLGSGGRPFGRVFNKERTLPFPRLSYDKAMDLYGTDKPDLRFGLTLLNVTELMGQGKFKVFNEIISARTNVRSDGKSGGLIKCLKIDNASNLSRKEIDKLTEVVKQTGAPGLVTFKMENNQLTSPVGKFFQPEVLNKLINQTGSKNGDLILMVAGQPDVVNLGLATLRNHLAEKFGLIKKDDFKFCWVVDFPLFEYSQTEKRIQSKHHPFTAPAPNQLDLLETKPLEVKARAYDLVVNGVEIGGGSIRIHAPDLQQKIFQLLKLSSKAAQEKFGFLIEALKYGAPPHGGIALGLDRLVMVLLGLDSIREVIAFPKTATATCLLTNAPASVNPNQLKELEIKLSKVKPKKPS